jgi:hypothetical protein
MWKPFHDSIFSLRGKGWTHKDSLSPPLDDEVATPVIDYEYLYTTVVSYQTRNALIFALKWTMKKIFLNVTATKSNGKISETLS